MTVIIAADAEIVTLINVFTPKPGKTDDFAQLQVSELKRLVPVVPGYISASIHVSLDKRKVANYAQFISLDAFEAWQRLQLFGDHIRRIEHLIERARPSLYYVAAQIKAPAKTGT